MKKFVLTLAAALALPVLSSQAAVAYFVGTQTDALLSTSGAATVNTKVVTLVVDLASGHLCVLTITAPSKTAGKNFDYVVGFEQAFQVHSFTSTNGASYTYLSATANTPGSGFNTQRQALLYGANVSTQLSSTSQSRTLAPVAMLGSDVNLLASNSTSGSVRAFTFNAPIVLQATQFANAGGLSLQGAVDAARQYYNNNLKGQEVQPTF